MKSLITIITLLTLSTMAFADHGDRHRPGKGGKATTVRGEKAKTIFEAVDAEVVTKDGEKFTLDVKEVAALKCVKRIKKEDTSVVKYSCSLSTSKVRGSRGRRGNREGRRHQRRGRRGNRGHRG